MVGCIEAWNVAGSKPMKLAVHDCEPIKRMLLQFMENHDRTFGIDQERYDGHAICMHYEEFLSVFRERYTTKDVLRFLGSYLIMDGPQAESLVKRVRRSEQEYGFVRHYKGHSDGRGFLIASKEGPIIQHKAYLDDLVTDDWWMRSVKASCAARYRTDNVLGPFGNQDFTDVRDYFLDNGMIICCPNRKAPKVLEKGAIAYKYLTREELTDLLSS